MPEYRYDFFIAYARPDANIACDLYVRLTPHARVFLDSRSLLPGDDWDIAIPEAQAASSATIALVSKCSSDAFYERDEIRAAIALSRRKDSGHKIVPIYTCQECFEIEGAYYGLRLKQGFVLSPSVSIDDVCLKLLQMLPASRAYKAHASQREYSCNAHFANEAGATSLSETIRFGVLAIHRHLHSVRAVRIHTDSALEILSNATHTTAIQARELLQVLVDKGYLSSVSGNRLELSVSGLRIAVGKG